MEPAIEAAAPGAYAFRCRNCNTLEEAAAAGENATPAACRTCGAGVSWEIVNGQPVRTLNPENWIILAGLAPDELAPILDHHAISSDEIVAHDPFTTTYERGPDTTEIVTHACPVCEPGIPGVVHRQGQPETTFKTRPVHDCKACAANRPGTGPHVEGAQDEVTIPTWVPTHTSLAGATPPERTPVNIERSADETPRSKDVTA